jgi:hypothetical protein
VTEWQRWWQKQADELADDPATRLALRHGFVVRTDALLAAGWSHNDIRRAVRRGMWSRPAHGALSPVVLAGTTHEDVRRRHALQSAAGSLLRPDHVVSEVSAAIVHGLPTLAVPDQPVLTTRGLDAPGRRRGALIRSATVDDHAVASWFGMPVSTVARTIVDVARNDRRDGIIAVDAALRDELVTADELAVELVGAAGWRGVRQARAVVALADPLAESPLESLIRLALDEDGFPPPQLQFPIGGFRVDFCWPQRRLILEADGRVKYSDDALWLEKRRESQLRALGYWVERVLWSDLFAGWPATSRRLRRHFVG